MQCTEKNEHTIKQTTLVDVVAGTRIRSLLLAICISKNKQNKCMRWFFSRPTLNNPVHAHAHTGMQGTLHVHIQSHKSFIEIAARAARQKNKQTQPINQLLFLLCSLSLRCVVAQIGLTNLATAVQGNDDNGASCVIQLPRNSPSSGWYPLKGKTNNSAAPCVLGPSF